MINNLNDIVRLTKNDIEPAARMLVRTFYDNPIFVYYFPDSSEREDKLQSTFEFMIKDGIKYGETYATSTKIEGIAVWYPSEKAKMTPLRALMNDGLSLFLKVGIKSVFKMIRSYNFIYSMHDRLAPFSYWYLSLIGVDPKHQGKGYGSILLKSMLTRIDNGGLPCYLDTNDEKNVSIYRHYGFKVIETYRLPKTNYNNWAMIRKKSNL